MQFFVAVACLGMNDDQLRKIAVEGWRLSSNATRTQAETRFDCCGFNGTGPEGIGPDCKALSDLQCIKENNCSDCWDKIRPRMDEALRVAGGIGLFFSFTEVN